MGDDGGGGVSPGEAKIKSLCDLMYFRYVIQDGGYRASFFRTYGRRQREDCLSRHSQE